MLGLKLFHVDIEAPYLLGSDLFQVYTMQNVHFLHKEINVDVNDDVTDLLHHFLPEWKGKAFTLEVCAIGWPLYFFTSWVFHDDVIKWKHIPRYWPFVRRIHRSPVNSPHKGQWRGALMFSLICVWINDWVNNREAGDLRRYRIYYDVTVMIMFCLFICLLFCNGQIEIYSPIIVVRLLLGQLCALYTLPADLFF